jgi:sulfotransferase
MKDIFFLHGLPRAGNTVFSSIMNQNPDVAATANSICADMIGELYLLKHTDIFKNFPDHKSFDNVAKTVFENYYKDWKQDYIIDRAPWGYPINLKFLKETKSNIKIIILVRDIIEVLGSFLNWSEREPSSFVNQYEAKTVEEKCDMLMNKEGQIVKELIGVKHLLDYQPKEIYHLIKFNDLVENTENTIDGVYNFLDIPKFKHDFNNISQFKVNDMGYDDTVVGNGLHTLTTGAISNYKEKYDAYSIVPKNIIDKYKQCNYWIK